MSFIPLSDSERESLLMSLRRNADGGVPIMMSSRDTTSSVVRRAPPPRTIWGKLYDALLRRFRTIPALDIGLDSNEDVAIQESLEANRVGVAVSSVPCHYSCE